MPVFDLVRVSVLIVSLKGLGELHHRLGFMNTENPTFPDGLYELDLRSREQREMAKVLVALAIDEPGENWQREEYRWSRFDMPIPGWQLPTTWATEDHELEGDGGPRRFGRLKLNYTSDPKFGCNPNAALRKKLTERFLCGQARPH